MTGSFLTMSSNSTGQCQAITAGGLIPGVVSQVSSQPEPVQLMETIAPLFQMLVEERNAVIHDQPRVRALLQTVRHPAVSPANSVSPFKVAAAK